VDSLLDEFAKEERLGWDRVSDVDSLSVDEGRMGMFTDLDHTSSTAVPGEEIRYPEPNISQWRRAVCGDLTSAFDFAGDADRMCHRLRSEAIASQHRPYQIPNVQVMPAQESGTRPARALPYEFMTQCRVEADKISVEFISTGKAGAAFYAYTERGGKRLLEDIPSLAGKVVSDYWICFDGEYDIYDLWAERISIFLRGKLDEGTR